MDENWNSHVSSSIIDILCDGPQITKSKVKSTIQIVAKMGEKIIF